MKYKLLGKTSLQVSEVSFGALPIQRIGVSDATAILRKAYDGGINFFDTARAYTDSEQKLGEALHDVRASVIFSDKTMATTGALTMAHIEQSLKQLRTHYIDLYQHHNPTMLSNPEDESGVYYALQTAKKQGKIRHIGITQHKLMLALKAIESGLYDTLQFPLSYLSDEKELDLIDRCKEAGMGLIAMKALAGGLLTHTDCAYAFFAQDGMSGVVPIWGIQTMQQLQEFLSYSEAGLSITPQMQSIIMQDKQALSGSFCRSCGYCLPCSSNIDIPQCARMMLLLRRMPYEQFITEEWQQKMRQIEECTMCGKCKQRCPYFLNTPALLLENLTEYDAFLKSLSPKE